MSHDWLDTPPAADPEVYGQRLSTRERTILQRDLQSLADSLGFAVELLNRPSSPPLTGAELSYLAVAANINRSRVIRLAQAWGVPVSPLPASTEGSDDAAD